METVLITGAASMLGAGIAGALAGEARNLILSDIDMERAGALVEALGGRRAAVSRMDVTDRAEVAAVVADVIGRYGRIDALVNCAGGMRGLGVARQPFAETPPESWHRILDVNLHGVWNCCHAVLPHMIAAGRGNIVSIAAGRGLRGGPNASIYSAAKAGVIVFTQSLAQEVGPQGIRANTIAPGNAVAHWKPEAETVDRSPLGRGTTGEDVGNAVAFLLSERASHITGSCLDISGGNSLH